MSTYGRRVSATTAWTTAAIGATVIVYGVLKEDIPSSIGGAALPVPAVLAIALTSIRRWIADTSLERRGLAAATQELSTERAKYFAAKATLQTERQRILRDAAASRASAAAALKVEREAMHDAFEDQRAELVCRTIEATVKAIRSGTFDVSTPAPAKGVVTQLFPQQQPEPERARERDRGAR